MTRRTKKRAFRLLLVCLFLYFLWSGFIFIRHSTPPPAQAAADPHEIIGIYHVHSTFSDGHKSPEDIARIAARQGLDFVILTDHGHPNYSSLASQGWLEGVLWLAGSELSVNRGHLVGMGFKTPSQPFSLTAELAAAQIAQAQGITVIAHPYSKVRWTWGDKAGYSGIEILSADAILRQNFLRLLPILPLIAVKPRIPMLKLLHHPARNLRKWDELCRDQVVYGYYSCDAHFWYSPLFSSLRLHLLAEKELSADFAQAQDTVFSALRDGHFFNAVDAAAPSQGFRFRGQKPEGPVAMGSTTSFLPLPLHIQAPPGLAREVHLLHNGQIIHRTSEEETTYTATQAGTYRVEVYLKERTPMSPECPWILSNPIFIRKQMP
jgi:hypothetical protein